jgi:hypothetical protein
MIGCYLATNIWLVFKIEPKINTLAYLLGRMYRKAFYDRNKFTKLECLSPIVPATLV